MATRRYADRSRVETYQRCARARFWEYEHAGRGLAPVRKPLPLAVGGSVHEGLAVLLSGGDEEQAVATALADFAKFRDALEMDLAERTAMEQGLAAAPVPDATLAATQAMHGALSSSLGLTVEEAGLAGVAEAICGAGDGSSRIEDRGRQWDAWLYAEQSALVEGMVRAWARRRLRPLLEEYEVLEVEREGEWVLAEYLMPMARYEQLKPADHSQIEQIVFMSRPDALLRSRRDNGLYLQSFKTAATWDVRKARDAEHDMQGLSEGVEVERRLAEWWFNIHHGAGANTLPDTSCSPAMYEYLHGLTWAPRILGIRYEYLLKGDRWKDKDLSQRFGFDVRSQRSPLIRVYTAVSVPARSKSDPGYSIGDRCWSWDYQREDGSSGSLAWQNWKSRPAWDGPGGIRAWIDALDASEEAMSAYDSTTGMEPRPLGWKSGAQALGFTRDHPLDSVLLPPIIVYRQDEELRDWIEQVEWQERRVAEGMAEVAGAADEGDRRSALNRHFPMTRRACEYPSTCAFARLCWGSQELRDDPVGSGLYKVRVPNHPVEGSEPACATPVDNVQK